MASDKELLEDTSFDREVAPRDEAGNLLVSLLRKRAFDENTGVLLSQYPIKEEQLDKLIKEERVKLYSSSPVKICLTKIGKIVACGEFSLREREKKKRER